MPEPNPFHGITDLFTELGRARELGTHGREYAVEDRQRTHARAFVPATDIFVQGDRLVIRIELAVGTAAAFVVAATFYVRERFYGAFRRSITLPEGTKRDQIQARFDDGLVEIVVEGVGERTEAASRIELRDRSSAATTRSLE